MFFGRNKSKHRKGDGEVTVSGLKISNPTPLAPIRVNGNYIDLRAPGDAVVQNPSSAPSAPPMPLAPGRQESDRSRDVVREPWLVGSSATGDTNHLARGAADPKLNAGQHSELATRPPANLVPAAARPPPPAQSRRPSSREHPEHPSSRPQPRPHPSLSRPKTPPALRTSAPQLPPPLSSLPSQPSTPSSAGFSAKNFSRKLGPSPTPGSVPQTVGPLDVKDRPPTVEVTKPDPVSPVSPATRQKPARRSVSSGEGRPVSRGRQKTRESTTQPAALAQPGIKNGTQTRESSAGSIYRLWAQTRTASPASQRSSGQKRDSSPPPLAQQQAARHLRITSQSSSIYSRTSQDVGRDSSDLGSVAPLDTSTAPVRQSVIQPRAALPRLDTKPGQLDSVGFFNPRGLGVSPVSPLLPSPPRRRSSDTAQLYTPAPVISPPSSTGGAPKLQLDLNLDRPDTDLSDLFSNSDSTTPTPTTTNPAMPGRISTPVLRTTISSPQSPANLQLPSYLGTLQDVRTTSPISPTDSDQRQLGRPSLGRKVSTRLRGLVSSSRSQSPPSPRRRAVSKDAISNPAPIPEDKLEPDPEIAKIKAQFDIGLSSQPRAAHKKVDEWNYNPSAATSKSSVSELQKGQTFSGRNSPASTNNPGLTSPRSSSERDPALDSPITPHDDRTFAALRASSSLGSDASLKQPLAPALRQQSYQSSGTQRSLDVPMFLDTEAESQSITEEPEESESLQSAGLARSNSIMTSEVERQLESRSPRNVGPPGAPTLQRPNANQGSDTTYNGEVPLTPSTVSTMRSPALSAVSASTAATSIPSPVVSPGLPKTPRSANARPPFAGDRKLLRSATMSSRPGGSGGPRPAPKMPPPTRNPKQENGARKPPVRSNTVDPSSPPRNRSISPPINKHLHKKQLFDDAPRPSNRQNNDAFSFAASIDLAFGRDDDNQSMIFPEDSISVIGAPASQRPPRSSRPVSPTSETDWQPQINLRPARSFTTLGEQAGKNNRVAALRVGADFTTHISENPTSPSLTGSMQGSDSSSEPVPGIKRTKSYGEGLRRAFSRRKPEKVPPMPSPSPPPALPPTVEEESSAPTSTVSGPQGMGIGSSQASLARWNTKRAAAAPTSTRALPTTALKLTAEDRSSVVHKSGTLFIKTVNPDGEIKSHHMKPRKGYAVQEACAFCQKGPFANMWVCLDTDDDCHFVVCRMCCNERVQEGEAELF